MIYNPILILNDILLAHSIQPTLPYRLSYSHFYFQSHSFKINTKENYTLFKEIFQYCCSKKLLDSN